MKKTLPVLAFLGIAAAAYAAYRKHKADKQIQKEQHIEERAHFSDLYDGKIPQEVDDNAKQSYRIQARLMAEGYMEDDVLDLEHRISFENTSAMFAFVRDAKAKHYHLDEAGSDNSVTVRLHMPATADAIYSSILEVAEMSYTNKGSYKGFKRTTTDIE
jgi:hypothetical protein